MEKLTIIFPEHKDFTVDVDESAVLMYPETETTPANQIQAVTTWINMRKQDGSKNVTVVSISPYVIECAIKCSKDVKIVYSDGKNTFDEAKPIFTLMAQPFKDMFLINT